jgi:peroxiredoxin
LRARDSELEAAGARLVFVGTGTPAMAADFARAHAGPHPVLSDTARASFQAAGMRRSPWSFLHWRFLRNVVRAFRRGFRQTKVQGDPWQQGGVLVFDAQGRLRHEQADRAGGDPLDLDAVFTAVRS